MRRILPALRTEQLVALVFSVPLFAFLPMRWAAPIAALAAVLCLRWIPRLDFRQKSAFDRQISTELPVVLDMLALSLDAGISWDRALRLAASGASGDVRQELEIAGSRLALGATPKEVWRGGRSLHLIGAVVERSYRSGGAVSTLLAQQADSLRAAERMRRITAVRKLESTILLPLTAIGLPAFLIGGIVPAGASMLSDLLGPMFSTLR